MRSTTRGFLTAGALGAASVVLAVLLLRPAPPVRVEGPDLLASAVPVTEAQARAAAPVLPGAVLGASVRRGERGEIVVSDSPLDLGDGTRLRLTRGASAGIDLVREESGVAGSPPRRAPVLLRSYPLPALPPDGRVAFVPRFLLSPDRAWLLRVDDGGGGGATAPDRDRVARCTAIPLAAAAGEETSWTVVLPPGDVLLGAAWRPDSRGWLAWRARVEPAGRDGGAPTPRAAAASRYTMLEARLGSPGVREGITLPEAGMFPAMLGRLPDGRTLAVESVQAKAPATARLLGGELTTGPVSVFIDVRATAATDRFYDGRDVVRILGEAAAKVRLVRFDGLDAGRVGDGFSLDVPPHASEAQLSLSPDGRRLAWFVRVPPVDGALLPILRALTNRQAPSPRLRDGAAALYLADRATGGHRVVAVLPVAAAEDRASFWWDRDSKHGYVGFRRALAPGAYAREQAYFRVPLP